MTELFKLMTVEQAWDIFRENIIVPIPQSELIRVTESLGRIVAEDLVSAVNIPDFDRSTMDGYAVMARDTFGATDAMPAMLDVIGEVLMGQNAEIALKSGKAIKIATGGMLPPGADAVVMVEFTEQLDETTILVVKPVAPGENMVRCGEDIAEGETVVAGGAIIRPQEMGAMAGLGITSCNVVRKPRVAVLSTGDEVVEPDRIPGPGQVRDINSFTISGLVEQAGGIPVRFGITKDEFDSLRQTLSKACRETDILVLSGGSSVGTRDVSSAVINSLGKPGVLVHGVSVRPGKPVILGVVDKKPVIGLPGHPASAMVLADIFLIPLIRAFSGLGYTVPYRRNVRAVMGRSMASTSGRVDYIRVNIAEKEGTLTAEPILGKSGLITTMVKAEGIVIIPATKEGVEAGEEVDVVLY